MYRIIIKKPAKKFIEKLPMNEKRRIVAAIEGLPDMGDRKRMQGHDLLQRARALDVIIIQNSNQIVRAFIRRCEHGL